MNTFGGSRQHLLVLGGPADCLSPETEALTRHSLSTLPREPFASPTSTDTCVMFDENLSHAFRLHLPP
ncbi:hypothetical protein [Aureliella helgolandensis]|uniref:Uncharacterized protein n=1 Tax=Aureliella helgolandensis TaxID=2527968 RepID=A0A518GCX7_9BACT|nr:hypothetical protein [Aureliella helgolandensis]QDV26407.1 hypothetical protein Q31a_47810 [Aureliella helgolandensis]